MGKEKMKRAGEREDETDPRFLDNYNINHKAKKRDLYGINLAKKENQQKEVESTEKASSSKTPQQQQQQKPWDSRLALGVFDFPWLKDGFISKTEYHYNFLDFEDKFSSSLENHLDDGVHYFSSEACSYCENSLETSKMLMETDVWQPFESDNSLKIKAEDLDCIWSALVNNSNHEGKILM